MYFRLLGLLCITILLVAGAAPKKTKVPVVLMTVHSEAEARDTEKFARPIVLLYAKRATFVAIAPDLTDRDVLEVRPFPAADGTMGVHLKLSPGGRIRLEGVTGSKLGKALVVFIQGRQVVDYFIDKRIEDGVLVIPSGLTRDEVASLEERAVKNRKAE